MLNPSFDPADVHLVREVSLDREDLHISLSDGTLALMRTVDGRVTGAVFEGQGEILLIAPDRAERTSLALFTGAAVLEQRFTTAYLRFVDDKLVDELQQGFRPLPPDEKAQDFISRWLEPSRALAPRDSLPLVQALTNTGDSALRYLHIRLGGTTVGVFDVFLDSNATEQISVAQANVRDQNAYYDVWTSFPMRSMRNETHGSGVAHSPSAVRFELRDYNVRVSAEPPSQIRAEAEVTLVPHRSGQRTFVLELSRYLKLDEVRMQGQPLQLIQNEAVSGSDLARRGDDLIGIMFPAALEKERPVRLQFKYSGPVMFDTGGGLLYVGSRGTWYPNAGPNFSNYDLTFDYPADWTLVATGKPAGETEQGGRRTSRFVTQKPIARAGFNLGRFEIGTSQTEGVQIHTYAAKVVEQSLAARTARVGRKPEPSREVKQLASQTAAAVQFMAGELDPFPYADLQVTQLPGMLSQSWPGLIYLSSMAFLDADERRAAGVRDPYTDLLLSKLMLAHETGHQWWGDAVDWVSYRDEWIIEALANYSALLMLEKDDPQAMRTALQYYRGELLRETPNGIIADAGPVTLGQRLTSSHFPDAYERVLYGRGTWLIHMLRHMLRQASGGKDDALFFTALKGLLARSPNHKISTGDLEAAFEAVLPRSLTFESKRSLDWFFDTWVNGASIPQLALEDVKIVPAARRNRVTGSIRQARCDKDLVTAVPIYAVDAQGKSRFLSFVFVDDPKTDFTLLAPAGTKQILLDPEGMVLRR
ncbi:MAG TPA: M1 family aminopeptidase [Candidatus Limnocylindrales bacterium]|nr:M1 family aminopeptidase [Candidatus Limnocylindrales bacterium]